MKKFVLKLELIDEKDKRKAFKTVSALSGIDQISIDMKGKMLTVVGTVDPVSVVTKLRKFWPTDIISIGPAKEPEKNEEQKKEEGKEETKGDQPTKDESKQDKKNEVTKMEEQTESVIETILPYYMPYYPPASTYRPHYYPPINTSYYVNHSVEENSDACVIC